MLRSRSLLFLLALCCLPPTARAADDALAPGIYADPDPAAVVWYPAPGNRGKYRELLNKEVQRHPRNVVARVQRAYLLDRAGNHERAQRDYEAALDASAPDSLERRHILWSRGWSRYDMGDIAGALADWRESVRLHGGHPSWVAYTFALAYWTQDDKPRALAWYDAAAASKQEWSTEAGMTDNTRHWRPEQRERIQALFEHWNAARAQPVDPAGHASG